MSHPDRGSHDWPLSISCWHTCRLGDRENSTESALIGHPSSVIVALRFPLAELRPAQKP
jgi:hypothetical protein